MLKSLYDIKFSLILILCFSGYSYGQDVSTTIAEHYSDYAEAPRELAYVHLNKSTYIQGEDIGFTAYILDKKNNRPSTVTTNLYVTLEDSTKQIIAQKLLKVENGIAANVIELDSTFTSGYYTFKAYTNWMRNFDEPNYFIESLRIIDPKQETSIKTVDITNQIDAQFLPEGGHLLNNVVNTIGVIIKDKNGYGVPNLNGSVYDKNNFLITEFEVNHLGIGRFPLFAELGNNYTIKINYLNETFDFNFKEKIEPVGVSLSVSNYKNLAIAVLNTNEESLKVIKNKSYTLALHNGNKMEEFEIMFNDSTSIVKPFNLDDIPSGLNIFTLFNEDNKAISERLFFNYNGLKTTKSKDLIVKKERDSVNLNLGFDTIDSNEFHNISVSVLPKETQAYKRNQNILSYNLIQPYLNGTIEQARYYFNDVNDEVKRDLDNLLITQGWSSYDWSRILGSPSKLIFPFEQGINLNANINNKDKSSVNTFVLHATNGQESQIIQIDESQTSFLMKRQFVFDENGIYISEIKGNNTLTPPQLYMQASPSVIPYLKTNINTLKPKVNYNYISSINDNVLGQNPAKDEYQLDEVVVISQKSKDEIRTIELSKHRFGDVKIVSDVDRDAYFTLQTFLSKYGIQTTYDELSEPKFWTPQGRRTAISGDRFMTVFVDDVPLSPDATGFLREFPLSNVDYVEINRNGVGEGFRGLGGVLKIYTNRAISFDNRRTTSQKIDIPLTFSSEKRFYIPKYQYYNDDFYKRYGTVDWKPKLSLNLNGTISIKIAKPEVPITLFIEGITNDGTFILEEKTIEIN